VPDALALDATLGSPTGHGGHHPTVPEVGAAAGAGQPSVGAAPSVTVARLPARQKPDCPS
jgi:hypothetical protein